MKLSESVDRYIEQRRDEGLQFTRSAEFYKAFSRRLGDVQLSQVGSGDILKFLDEPITSPQNWRRRYQHLVRFFTYWACRKMVQEFVMPPPRLPVPQIYAPHVYTRAELSALLRAIAQIDKAQRSIAPQTLRAFLLLLYGTGSLVGEMIVLRCSDVDLKRACINISDRNNRRVRRLPIGRDMQEVLHRYIRFRSRCGVEADYFFTTKKGTALPHYAVMAAFRALRQAAGIATSPSMARPPRMDDLRITFAVHRITSWIRNGANLNRMLPALAVYMGQSGLGATEKYLLMTPEHYRKQLNILSPKRGKQRWRDDKELMAFVNAL